MEVTIREGLLRVKFWKTHLGHSMDLEHINLSKAARTEIAEKMKQGQSFQQILNEIRSGKLVTVEPQRALLVKRKDLHNIFRDFRIGSKTKQSEPDVGTSEMYKTEMQQTDEREEEELFQQTYKEISEEQLQETGPQEEMMKVDDPLQSTFEHYEDTTSTLTFKDDGVNTSGTTQIQEIAESGPILYFEEQHPQATQVIQIATKKIDYTVTYYEEVGAEDSTVSDHEMAIEKDQNGFPVLYHEDVTPDNNETINKTAFSDIKIAPLKSGDICCPDCGQVFTKKKNLYAHMRNIHKMIGDCDPISAKKCPKNEICSLCGKAFSNKSTARRHRQKIHNEGVANSHTPRIRCPVPECMQALSSYSHLREHLGASHQTKLAVEEMHFMSEQDFLIWKDSVQTNTVSFYVLDTSKKVMKDGTEKKYYNCHRSHSYKSSGNNIRKLKSTGSRKIGCTCPSRLEVVVQNGELDVKFWKTHLGHGMDVGHTTLSKAVRIEIAEMLKRGDSFEHVLDAARNGRLQDSQSQRTPLLKRKDLHNICRDFHIAVSSVQSTNEITGATWCV